jgi:hypothetical protein
MRKWRDIIMIQQRCRLVTEQEQLRKTTKPSVGAAELQCGVRKANAVRQGEVVGSRPGLQYILNEVYYNPQHQ